MTDNDIIKALECCLTIEGIACDSCPVKGDCISDSGIYILHKRALDLINRQQAEIERLTAQKMSREEDRDYWMAQTRIARDNIKFAKTEAIKEFAELIKEESDICYLGSIKHKAYRFSENDLNHLVRKTICKSKG